MKNTNLSDSAHLRQKAEERLKIRTDVACNVSTVADTQKLIHELEVHQIELEMQNNELILAKEQAAIASEKYIELYDFAPTGYFTLSQTGQIIQLNLCSAAMLGKVRQKLIGSSFIFFVSPDTKPIFIQFFDKLFTSQTKETCEVALNTAGNVPIFVHLTGIATTENDQCFITAVDITERKHAEDTLSTANEFNKLLLQTIPFGMDVVDENGNILFLSESLKHHFGIDAMGKKCWELFCDDKMQCPDCPLQSGIKLGLTETYEVRGVLGGKIFEVSHTGMIFKGQKAMLEIFVDITERKKADEALRKSESEFRLLAESMPQIVWITRPDGWNIFFNQKWVNYTGLSLEESYGGGWIKPFHPDDKQLAWDAWQKATTNLLTYSLECRLRRFDGEYKWWLIRGVPVLDEQGSVVKWFGTCTDIDEMKKSEQDLIAAKESVEERERNLQLTNERYVRSNQLLEESQSIARVGGYEYNLLTGELYWTAEAYRVHDTSPDEFKPTLETGINYFLPESKRIIQEAFELTMSEGKSYDLDLETYTTKGRKINVRTTCQVSAVDGKGKPVKFTGIFQDITEQKKTEQDLIAAKEHAEESGAMLKAAMENSQAGVAIAEFPSGKLKYVNKAAMHIRDKGYDEIVKDSELDNYVSSWHILHPDGTPFQTDEVPLARAILYAETNSSEFIVRRDNNEDRFVWANAAPIFNSKGIQTAAIVVFLDITERKLNEEKLKESIALMRIAGEKAKLGGWNVNLKENRSYWSDEVAAIHEMPAGFAPLVEDGINFYAPEWRERIIKVFTDCVQQGISYDEEMEIITSSGKRVWINTIGEAVRDDKGNIFKVHGAFQDISARKTHEGELIAAKEHAEESDRLKTSFLANMSHEIRTPMNSIMGFASLLPEEESKELINNYASIIVKNSEQLVHIIDDIVLYSRLQTGLLSFQPNLFNAKSLLNEVKQSFNLPEFTKDVELKIETGSEGPVIVNSDFEKLRQIFTNLVSNAFKYTTKGSITIGFTHKEEEFVFFVKDTGIGIPQNELERVFERFYRGSNVNKGAIGGTGLGLSIVKELVNLLGGKIWVVSNQHQESTFYFTIPNN